MGRLGQMILQNSKMSSRYKAHAAKDPLLRTRLRKGTARGKHIHFVGICGVGMSAIAIALHKANPADGGINWKVTGSDKGFYPPVSNSLEEAGVTFYSGFHPERLIEGGIPDMIVAGGGGTASSNPELIYARENNIPILSYPELLQKYFVRKNSVVTVGTWGKTTCTAFLAHILSETKLKPSYMIGGIPINLVPGKLDNGSWSVIEGDEYQSAIWDKKAKFWYYSPTHLLLTSVSWDHADLYPTEDDYFATFEKLVASIPEDGLIVACIDNPGVRKVIGHAKCRVVTYGSPRLRKGEAGKRSSADYKYLKVGESREGLRFGIMKDKKAIAIESRIIGGFQAENITGCFVMAKEIGIPTKTIISSIASLAGIKRRFEKRFENEKVTVFDCHAPTPEKARSVLRDLRKIYPSEKIVAIFEPNIGGRTPESSIKYTDAFSAADTAIIPLFTKLKIDANAKTKPLDSHDISALIARGHSDTRYIPNDTNLVTKLFNFATPPPNENSVIVFLGSHSFRQMIEQLVEKLRSVSV